MKMPEQGAWGLTYSKVCTDEVMPCSVFFSGWNTNKLPVFEFKIA
jgi:hypothetical protein